MNVLNQWKYSVTFIIHWVINHSSYWSDLISHSDRNISSAVSVLIDHLYWSVSFHIGLFLHCINWLASCLIGHNFSLTVLWRVSMSSNINVSLENPYGQVTIPRAKLHSSSDSTVIANPMVITSNENPYQVSSSAPPPYTVKEDGGGNDEGGSCRACCYRCRRKKWHHRCRAWCHNSRRLVTGSDLFICSSRGNKDGRKWGNNEGRREGNFMNWRMFSRCGHFVSQILTCLWSSNLHPSPPSLPRTGISEAMGTCVVTNTWGVMASLWCPADFGDHRDFWDSGSLWGPGFFFALDGILFFYWQFYINTYKKILGRWFLDTKWPPLNRSFTSVPLSRNL